MLFYLFVYYYSYFNKVFTTWKYNERGFVFEMAEYLDFPLVSFSVWWVRKLIILLEFRETGMKAGFQLTFSFEELCFHEFE